MTIFSELFSTTGNFTNTDTGLFEYIDVTLTGTIRNDLFVGAMRRTGSL